MSDGMMMLAARLGDRVTDNGGLEEAGLPSLGGALQLVLSETGVGAAIGAFVGGAMSLAKSAEETLELILMQVEAQGTIDEIVWVAKTVFIGKDKLPTALSDHDDQSNGGADETLETGALAVFVDNWRMGRAGDLTLGGNMVYDGEQTVLVGGPPTKGAPVPNTVMVPPALGQMRLLEGGPDVAAQLGDILSMDWIDDVAADVSDVLGQGEAVLRDVEAGIGEVEGRILDVMDTVEDSAVEVLETGASTAQAFGDVIGAGLDGVDSVLGALGL